MFVTPENPNNNMGVRAESPWVHIEGKWFQENYRDVLKSVACSDEAKGRAGRPGVPFVRPELDLFCALDTVPDWQTQEKVKDAWTVSDSLSEKCLGNAIPNQVNTRHAFQVSS